MKLKTLKLHNFKGIENFTLETQGKDVEIFGDNGTGKTTIFDAFTWLLFDKDSLNRADFEIKTLDTSGQPIHGLNHEVEGMLEIDAATSLTLKKVYSETWTKKRGSPTRKFTGHSTDHFVDGVPVKKNEYEARIAAILDENAFRLLTNPRYFNEGLKWQERRKVLMEISGDISDADVIASDVSLAKLPSILGDRKLDDHRKVTQSQKVEINKQLNLIPPRIDEVSRSLSNLTDDDMDSATIKDQAFSLRTQRREFEQRIAMLESGGGIAEKIKALREVEAQMLQTERGHRNLIADEIQSATMRLRGLAESGSNLTLDLKGQQRQIIDNQKVIDNLREFMNRRREEWKAVNAEAFISDISDICPTCLRPLPSDQVDLARETARINFNLRKAAHLESIAKEGTSAKSKVEGITREISGLEQSTALLETELTTIGDLVADARTTIMTLEKQERDYIAIPSYVEAMQKKVHLETAITALKDGSTEATESVRQEIHELDKQIADLEQSLAQMGQRENGLKRIEELKAEERKLAQEYERLESELYLCDQFVKTKVSILEDKINSKFALARFKMFNVLINGGIEECCETTYKGVPYGSGLNNGMRLNVGLDMINTLSAHYCFTAPIWLDNAEAVSQLLPTRGQQIRLYVSEVDKTLRMQNKKEEK